MTVQQLTETLGLRIFCMPDGDRTVVGGYAGDLLSWVMGRLEADRAWVTIMSNVNVVAVATLTDPACVILSEGVLPDEEMLKKATENGMNLLGCEASTFEISARISQLL